VATKKFQLMYLVVTEKKFGRQSVRQIRLPNLVVTKPFWSPNLIMIKKFHCQLYDNQKFVTIERFLVANVVVTKT